MSLRIRLARGGAKKRPFYRIVVADSRSPRDGRFIEKIGTYNPMVGKDHPQRIRLDEDRARHWISMGATPSERVARFLGHANVIAMPSNPERPKKSQPRPKTVERAKEKEEAKQAAAAAPPEEAPVVETPAEEVTAEAPPAAEEAAPAEEAPAEETKSEEAAPVEETPTEEAPAEVMATEAAPVEETPAEETKTEEAPAEETKAEDDGAAANKPA